jgi:hypothetical protein
MKKLIVLLVVSSTLLAQKRQAPNLNLEPIPAPGANCCLDVKISKWAGPHDSKGMMDVTSEVLGRRVSERISVWVVFLQNKSLTDTIRVSEASILSRLDNLNPYSHVEMELLMDRGQKLDRWALFARLLIDASTLLLLPVVGDLVSVTQGLKNAIAAFVGASPYIVTQVNGRAIPVRDNFNRLEWNADVDLKPGDSVIAHVFSTRWDVTPPDPMRIKIDTSSTGSVKVAR